jgi:hypothetical protein
MSSSAASAPLFDFKSSVTERLPRIITSFQRSRFRPRSPGAGRSTRITSAPMSASSIPANGPGPIASNSMTLIPESGPMSVQLLADHCAPAVIEIFRDASHLVGRHAPGSDPPLRNISLISGAAARAIRPMSAPPYALS